MTTDTNVDIQANYAKRSKRWKLILLGLIVALIVTIVVSLNIGWAPVSFVELLAVLGRQIPFLNNTIDPSLLTTVNVEAIIIQSRLPRIFAGVIIGGGLAAAGVLYQGVFKNPMADPFVLGVSAGAAVGAGLATLLAGGLSFFGFPIVPTAAFFAALIEIFVVYNISRVGSRVPEMTLLLTGIAMSIFLSAIYSALEVLASNYHLHVLVNFTIGGISEINWTVWWSIFPFIFIGIIISYFYSRDLNMITMGEETAQHLGVNTERTKKILLALGSMITAAAVSVSGLIGFVGLMIPHITRIIFGPDHRLLIPASVIVGAIYLVVCDTLARVIGIQVGIITAAVGGLFFIFLLRKKLNYRM
ncbi:MAG: FecCD family ABC transporter permease [Candidatus Bathyarchaeia archaeon]